MKKIYPCLWFENNIDDAIAFYKSVFSDLKITSRSYYGEGMHQPTGTILTVSIEIKGQEFMLLNGGPLDKFNHSISLIVPCDTQEEIDEVWDKLLVGGGEAEQCGWLRDKYGICWQIAPSNMGLYLNDKDQKKTNAAMKAVMGMIKLDKAAIEKAYKEG